MFAVITKNLPAVTAYLVAGLALGPFCLGALGIEGLGFQSLHQVEGLSVLTQVALGFIASAFKSSKNKMTKQRTVDIFNTGVTTVSTYLLQAVFGFGISMIACLFMKDFFPAAGVLLPFGYGQGTGQALNYGGIYEAQGFAGGKSFGLTVASMGFLAASVGGVIHLNWLKRKGKIFLDKGTGMPNEQLEEDNEVPMQENVDKFTLQIAFIMLAYLLSYLLMYVLGTLAPGMRSTIYGFNFLLGVLTATLLKVTLNFLRKKNIRTIT